MADHPILNMFGEIAPTEGSVLQEIGAIGAGANQTYNPNMNQLPGNSRMLTDSNAMPGLPQAAPRSYSNVGAPPQMSQDRTKIMAVPNEYPSSVSGMAMSAQYGSLTSSIGGSDGSPQHQSSVSQRQQQRYSVSTIGSASGGHQYRSQQYPYPNEQQTQYDGIQYSAASNMVPPGQQTRSITTPQQSQQYPNSWSSSSQAQSLNYMSPQRVPVRQQQQQHHYMDFNTQNSNEPQASASHQQMSHYPGANASSNISNQQHMGRTSTLSAASQMSMYHQQGYPQSSQQNNPLPNYGGTQSHPSMPQQISGYPQTSQPQRPSSSYYSNSGLGSRAATPQQQSYSHHMQQQPQQGRYTQTNHHPVNSQPSDAAVRLQHYQSSSTSSHIVPPQNGSVSQNTYYPPAQQSSSSAMLSPQQQFRPPAQPNMCPPDPHLASTPNVQNGTTQQFRSNAMSPRRPPPSASGNISPMPHPRTPERFSSVVNHPPQSTTPLSQGFASPRPLMSPTGQVSPVPNTQQTSLQQLEQMVMPGPKVADKPDVGLYSQITPIPSASVRNGTSPSYGLNLLGSQHQNISRPNMDNLGHGLQSVIPAANLPHNSYSNNGHPVPPSAAPTSHMPTMHELQPPSSVARHECLPVSSSSPPCASNHPFGPIQAPPSTSIFDSMTPNMDRSGVGINNSNMLLSSPSSELSSLASRVPPVSESQHTLLITTTTTSLCASPTMNSQLSVITSPHKLISSEVNEPVPPAKISPLVIPDNVHLPTTGPIKVNAPLPQSVVSSENSFNNMSQQQSAISTGTPLLSASKLAAPVIDPLSEQPVISETETSTNRLTPRHPQTQTPHLSPQMHSANGVTSPNYSHMQNASAPVPLYSTETSPNATKLPPNFLLDSETSVTIQPPSFSPESKPNVALQPPNFSPESKPNVATQPSSFSPEFKPNVAVQPPSFSPESKSNVTIQPPSFSPEPKSSATIQPPNFSPDSKTDATIQSPSFSPDSKPSATIQPPSFSPDNQKCPQSVSPLKSPLPVKSAEIAQSSLGSVTQINIVSPSQPLVNAIGVSLPHASTVGPPLLHLGPSPINQSSNQHFMPTLTTQSNSPPTLNSACTSIQPNQSNVTVSEPPKLSLGNKDLTASTNAISPALISESILTPEEKMQEVQNMQEKIQNLCTLPPTPQINKQILELQERIRLLQKDQDSMTPLAPAPNPPRQTSQSQPHFLPPQDSQTQQNQVLGSVDENRAVETAAATPPVVTKEKKPRKRKEKTPKTPKEPKQPNPIKEPKQRKITKSPRTLRRSGKKKNPSVESKMDIDATTAIPLLSPVAASDACSKEKDDSETKTEGGAELKHSTKCSKKKTVKSPKGRTVRARTKPSSKKKPLKLPIMLGKKRKRRRGSDISDAEGSPPSSPKSEDYSIQKRRSTRNTKRKKYVDDIDMNLIGDDSGGDGKDDDSMLDAVLIKPTQFYKSVSEDEMVVEKIFNHRMGTRILEYDIDEDEENHGKMDKVEEPDSKSARETEADENMDVEVPEKSKETKKNDDSNKVEDSVPDSVPDSKSNVPELDVCDEKSSNDGRNLPEECKNDELAVKTDKDNKNGKVKAETSASVGANQSSSDIKTENPLKDMPVDEIDVTFVDESETSSAEKKEVSPFDKTNVSTCDEINTSQKKVHTETIEVEEFYVKFKNLSYLHCEWRTLEELEKGDKRVAQKMKRYWQKRSQTSFLEDLDDEPFNPLYLEVDRVLDMSEGHEIDGALSQRHFLVKWQGLPYEESTWELEQDVDQDKIQMYLRFKDPPAAPDVIKTRKHLKVSDWVKIEESRVYKGGNKLREYQLEGVNWLTFCTYKGQNCILADEMGLGKTIQSITYLIEIRKCGLTGPYLVIAPLSTISNWQREFDSWSDMNVIVYHGSTASRNMIQEYEMFYKDEKGKKIIDVYKFEVMITTFEIVLTDVMELKEIPWKCCIIDEAHRLKNKNCKLLEGLRLIEMDQRVLLTGTPLQNNVEELFSLLNFLEPVRFASQESFLLEFGDLKTEGQVEKLQSILKPMMLRRLKEDVEKTLAPKEETIVEVELTNVQKKYYRAILERNFTFLAKGSNSNANVPNLMNTMMELRKCCIHPYLISGAEDQIVREYKQRHEDDEDVSFHALVHASGKLVLLDKLLPKLKVGGHRVLIFSQMVRCLDLLEDYLVHKRYLYERIDGRVRGNLRQAAIDRFSRPDSDRFAFLLCTRAGGLGINLTAADTVVIFDSDWNPQNDLQAQARCHRIGQEKAVKIYRLICRNTYEREMFDKASLKLGLDKAVLQSMNSSNKEGITQSQQLTKKEIEDLLKKGAYGALMEDDNAGDQFCEEDIDQILQRRTQVITLEAGVKGSKFAKASFSSSETRTDININDPEFWQKWAKKADVDLNQMDGKNELIMKEPRRRTQTRRYGNEDHLMELSELESSDDDSEGGIRGRGGKLRRGKKGKGREEEMFSVESIGMWNRTDCFKVERGLMTYGWGRWSEILHLSYFKNNVNEKNIEDMSRAILLYCSNYFHGDDQIKSFILDLITPVIDGQIRLYKNHSGLSAPIARGRKSKKPKKEKQFSDSDELSYHWPANEKIDLEMQFSDIGYKKHLQRQANRVLLRVRTLYYVKQEVIGNLIYQIRDGIQASDLPLPQPRADGDPPTPWWDEEADKSLLVGIFKHGYERYNLIRQDPTLCFVLRCGPPDGNELLAEISKGDEDFMDVEKSCAKDELDEETITPPASPGNPNNEASGAVQPTPIPVEPGMAVFPSASELNTRFRRLVTCYQRNHKKMEIRMLQKAKRMEKREKIEAAFREREFQKRQSQQRWSRREESDFYKTVSAFGVVYLVEQNRYDWSKFKTIARLDKKFDDTLTEYYKAFYAMCKRVCGKKLCTEEEHLPLMVEPITEERASRCLQRVDLLNNLRENIISHPKLDERLKLCQPSMDLPDWWICGRHDKDLLKGCAKHGLHRTDFHMLHDPTLCFREVIKNLGKIKSEQEAAAAAANALHSEMKESKNLVEKKHSNPDEKKHNNPDSVKDESKTDKSNEESFHLKVVKSEAKPKLLELNQEYKIDSKGDKKFDESTDDDNTPPKLDIAEGALQHGEDVMENKLGFDSDSKPELDKEGDIVPSKSKSEHKDCNDTKVISVKEENVESRDENQENPPNLIEKSERSKIKKKLQKSASTEESIADQSSIKSEEDDSKVEIEKVSNAEEKSIQNETEDTKKVLVKVEVGSTADTDLDLDRIDAMSQDSTTTNTPSNTNGITNNDDVLSQSSFSLDLEGPEPTVAQLIHTTTTNSNTVRWPKDKVLQMRLEHVCHAVEKNEWPTPRQMYMSYATTMPTTNIIAQQSAATISSGSPTPSLTRASTPQQEHRLPTTCASSMSDQHYRSLLDPMKQHDVYGLSAMAQLDQYAMSIKQNQDSLNSMNLHRKRNKRRRRTDSETEKAKLRMLLSHSFQEAMTGNPNTAFSRQMEDMRRSFTALDPTHISSMVAAAASLQPPSSMKSSASSKTPVRKETILPPTNTPPPAHQHSNKIKSAPLTVTPSGTLDLSKKNVEAHNSKPPVSSSSCSGAIDLSSGSASLIKSSGISLLKSNQKTASKPVSGSIGGSSLVNGEVPAPRTKPSIDDLALNLQYKKKKKLKEETMKLSAEAQKKEESKKRATISSASELGEVLSGTNKSTASNLGYLPIEAAAQFLSKPGGYPHSSSAASLLSEYKFAAANFPFGPVPPSRNTPSGGATQGSDNRSNSPAENVSDYLESKRRKRKQKVDPQLLDINEVTGDENISVVNRLTGKRLTGSKAPTLRELSLWLEQNPMFDVEAKWSQVVKEKGKLPENLKQRLISTSDKKKKLGIYSDFTSPLLGSAANASSLLSPPSSNNLAAMSAALGMGSLPLLSGFPSVKGAPVGGTSSSSGGASISGPGSSGGNSCTSSVPNNSSSPMFLPFGGLANLGLASPFFNLAGYGFPNIPGLTAAAAAGTPDASKSGMSSRSSLSKSSEKKSSSSSNNQNIGSLGLSKSSKSSRKSAGASSNQASVAAAPSMPFLFPSPNLLYNPMALSNFNLSQNMPTSFAASLAAQSGLLNSLVVPSTASPLVSSSNSVSSPLFSSTKSSSSSSNLPVSSTVASTLASHPLMQDDSDDESLKSLMGNHDDDDFPDDDEFDNLPPTLTTEIPKKSESSKRSLDSKRNELTSGDSGGDTATKKDSNSNKDSKTKSGSNS